MGCSIYRMSSDKVEIKFKSERDATVGGSIRYAVKSTESAINQITRLRLSSAHLIADNRLCSPVLRS